MPCRRNSTVLDSFSSTFALICHCFFGQTTRFTALGYHVLQLLAFFLTKFIHILKGEELKSRVVLIHCSCNLDLDRQPYAVSAVKDHRGEKNKEKKMCEGALGDAANVEETRKSTIKLFGTTISVSHCACKRRPAPASEAFAENDSHRRAKISKNTEDMTKICPAPASEAFAKNDSHRRAKISKNTEDMTEICPAPASEAFAENDSHRRAKISKKTEDMTEICCNSLEINTSLKPAIATVKSEEKPSPRPENSLACPRCQSIDTKFCYFNNYKVNQPRHFCRNCRRYWTAGGTLRDVPAGAARRKNKHSSEFQLRNADPAVDLHIRKPELHNLTESLQQTLILSAGVETRDSSCLEEMNGGKSFGFEGTVLW